MSASLPRTHADGGSLRKEQKAQTRALLMEAGRRCFERLGYDGTSVAAIAKEAGVAHGTLYVHFPSKDALLDELLVDFNETLAEKLQPAVAGILAARQRGRRGGLEATVAAIASTFLDHWEENRAFVACYARRLHADLGMTALRDGLNPPVGHLLEAAVDAAASGRGRKVHARLVSQALLSMWLRVGMQYLFGEGVSRAEALATLTAMTVGAVNALLGGKP